MTATPYEVPDLLEGHARWSIMSRPQRVWTPMKNRRYQGTWSKHDIFASDVDLGVVIWHEADSILSEGTAAFLDAHPRVKDELWELERMIHEERGAMPVAVKTDVSNAQLAATRKRTGVNVQRVDASYPSTEERVELIEAELRFLVEELVTHRDDHERLPFQAQALAEVAADVKALQATLDRLNGHLATARALFRGEIPM